MNAHHPFADSTEDTSHRWENPTRTGGVAHRGTLRNRRTPSAFCTLIVSQLGWFVKGFFAFFFERPLVATTPKTVLVSPIFECRTFIALPLTPIVYHRPHQKSTGNVAQIREKMRPEVCANCELTKSERCDIMEILPGAFDLGQPKTKGEVYPLPISTSASLHLSLNHIVANGGA